MKSQAIPTILLCVLFLCFAGACKKHLAPLNENLRLLQQYNVVWDSPSRDYHGSMPLGNGDISLNAWIEPDGKLSFYIGKIDTWGDNGRLLKLGKVGITFEPHIIFSEGEFRQELDLKSGTIVVHSKGKAGNKNADVTLQLWVDANHPIIHLSHKSTVPLKMTANIELWRTKPDSLPRLETSDLLEERSQPGSLHEPVIVEPDSYVDYGETAIGWYHFNKKSVGFELTNQLQGLDEFLKQDPILHRIFGAVITGTNVQRVNEKSLQTESSKSGILNVYVLTKHPSTPEKWKTSMDSLMNEIGQKSLLELRNAHEKWWTDFWDRSWIYATSADSITENNESDAFIVSRAYALQRFIDASAGRGNYPIKFNGSIFTVPSEENPGNADYRRWGPGYWWQNTRLPYLSMCAAGDFELMKPFFKMYAGNVYELNKFRTNKYFGIKGAYFPECIYFWGSVFTSTYGWTPYSEREDKLQESGYHKWEWVAGPELVFMMLDYYDYTQDEKFLQNKIVPLANDVMQFFDQYYSTNNDGRLVMHPSQALETWWDCTNPMPELAGLYSITQRLLALPERLTMQMDRDFWKSFQGKLPELPTRETPSGTALAPAEKFENKRNVENPSLYAVFPFRLFGVGEPKPEWAKNALKHRWDKGDFGWRQDDIFMAYLGLTDEARDNLIGRAKSFDKNSRFPAFWGPNYDWTPDQDHGGVLMKTFQSMLMQPDPYSKKIYLLPAWPKDWNANFKLHAPYQTVIRGTIKNGVVESLKVTPESRKEDIIIWNGQHLEN